MKMDRNGPLKILHVFRAPVGGLFRHVVDLVGEQFARGHRIGIVCDNLTGGDRASEVLAGLAPRLSLGVSRVAMPRNPGPLDFAAFGHVNGRVAATAPDVVHGHGSKGGFYARASALVPSASRAVRAYTPHGGSFNYLPGSRIHAAYMTAERLLARSTDVFLFESRYIANRFTQFVGVTRALQQVVCNGVGEAELVPVAPDPGAADFIYIGELRSVKGIDTMLRALAEVALRTGRTPRTVLVGSGPDERRLREQALALGLSAHVTFTGVLPARVAFAMGRTLVVPSRQESLPYVVLEAAAGRVPMISTNVGGIPEIFGPFADRLISCDDVDRLADAMIADLAAVAANDPGRARSAADVAAFVAKNFSMTRMGDAVIGGYRDALALRPGARGARLARVS